MSEFHESNRFAVDDEPRIVIVDLDETLCYYKDKRSYNLALPMEENIAKINKLFDAGCYIWVFTARGGSAKSKERGICYYDFTHDQLVAWGLKFHALSTGSKGHNGYTKMPYDLYICDKATTAEDLDVDKFLNKNNSYPKCKFILTCDNADPDCYCGEPAIWINETWGQIYHYCESHKTTMQNTNHQTQSWKLINE